MSELSLLSEVNRTSRLRPPTSEFDPTQTSSVLFYGPSSLLVVCKGGGATAALPLAPKGDLDDILSRVQR
jgi:hypothetical protein